MTEIVEQPDLWEKTYSQSEELLAVCQVITEQLIGFFKTMHLGIKLDSPSDSGSISRVGQVVTIYGYKTKSLSIK